MENYYPLLFTLAFTVLSVVFKLLSRRDGDNSPKLNDTYVGLSLCLGALSTSFTYVMKALKSKREALDILINEAGKSPAEIFKAHVTLSQETDLHCVMLIVICLLAVVLMALWDRYNGWKPQPNPEGKYQRWLAKGILAPNVFGSLLVYGVFSFGKYEGLI